MWFDLGGLWLTCDYMYRRFGVPFGKDWVAKTIEGYVHSAVVPRAPDEEAALAPCTTAWSCRLRDKFLGWWQRRYLPEIQRNFEYPGRISHGHVDAPGADEHPARGCD